MIKKLRDCTTIYRNMIWACWHILHNFQLSTVLARVNLIILSKPRAKNIVPASIGISTNIVRRKMWTT